MFIFAVLLGPTQSLCEGDAIPSKIVQSGEKTDRFAFRFSIRLFLISFQFLWSSYKIVIFRFFKDLESAEDRREREAQDMEYAKELAEDDDDLI